MSSGTVGALVLVAAACGGGTPGALETTGIVEVVETSLAPLTGGRVERVLVDEGDVVATGDTLLVLGVPTLASDLAQRRARAAAAQAALAEATAGPLPTEIAAAERELEALTAQAALAASDARRIEPLADGNYASAQQGEQARSAATAAAARRDAAAATLQRMRDGTRPERLAALRAELAAATAAVAALEATAHDLVLTAPSNGRIIVRAAEPGEVLAAGTRALVLAETRRQRVRIYVGQDVLPMLHAGDTVTAVLDAAPRRPFTGVIASLATQAEYTPRVALTERERADLLFAVRAEFHDTTETLKAGLPVTVRLTPRAP